MIRLVLLFCALVGAVVSGGTSAATLDGLAVDVTNASEPVLCAEKDNVTINLTSPEVRRFRVEATHPAYIGTLAQDRHAPDFTACQDLSPANTEVRPPRQVTFYEDVETWLTGTTFTNFWRPHDVPFRVADRVERGLHVVQLWVRRDQRAEEVLVIYPADGYWRIRPISAPSPRTGTRRTSPPARSSRARRPRSARHDRSPSTRTSRPG